MIVAPAVVPGAGGLAMLGGLAGGLIVLAWWLFFSRASWSERLGAIALMAVSIVAVRPLLHPSIAGAGMGLLFFLYAVPILCVAVVAWAVASRRTSPGLGSVSMVVAMLIASGAFTLVRTDGVTGGGTSDLHWRWTPTPEERLLAEAPEMPAATSVPPAPVVPESNLPASTPAAIAPGGTTVPPSNPPGALPSPASSEPVSAARAAAWPGFRGPNRDSVIHGVRIDTDWTTSPPVELWRHPVGPGWSSFAVAGDRIYTQEQRGDDEIVACYDRATGEPVWMHRDAARFWESNGGAGPRATPTVHDGRVYALGATGIVNALDAATGAVLWSRNAAADTGEEIPGWGFAGSPLAIDGLVVVAASGRLVAYDAATGRERWVGPPEGGGYSSPHLVTLSGVPQILLLRGARTTSVVPADGSVLWEHAGEPSVSIVQPAVIEDSDILIAPGDMMGGTGIRRIAVGHTPAGAGSDGTREWTVDERWTSRGLKPYFNDFVVHKGHAFGFDGSILACINLEDGARAWKGGRYGSGQLVLLADQDLLLVLSEEGDLALVSATPDRFTEVARVPGIEGKTWNHPVLVGDLLLVRNDREMAAFRLSLAGR